MISSLLLAGALAACKAAPGTPGRTPTGTGESPASSLSPLWPKPLPTLTDYHGCPPEGDGGDTLLNRLKNRSDEGVYNPVSFHAVADLPWPPGVGERDRSTWSAQDAATVGTHEGSPITIQGYLAGVKKPDADSATCHASDVQSQEWHMWLTETPGASSRYAIVVESTPRSRQGHPAWTIEAFKQLAKTQQPIRVSGWLMLDQKHPDQVGKSRATLWEIHPIMALNVQVGGRWVTLDSLAGADFRGGVPATSYKEKG